MTVKLQVVQTIAAVLNGRSLADLPSPLAAQERAYWQAMTYGCLRFLPRLELYLQRLLKKPLKNKDRDLQALLLLGLYWLDQQQAPEHAAVNETVQLCKLLNKPQFTGLCNALLRQYVREQSSLQQKLNGNPVFRFACPKWLIEQSQNDWPEQAKALLDGHNHPGPMSLRVNRRHGSRADYWQRLQDLGIEAQPSPIAEDSLVLAKPCAVEQLPGFGQGWASVQDEAATLAGQLLPITAGMNVLDACAAPGGKSCHLLERADIHLTALDSSAHRLQRLQENLERLQLQAKVVCADAGQPSSWWDGQAFDAILLDAPCTGLGVIRRHPDIKCLRQASDLDKLAQLQQQLLQALWPCLAKGGHLLYATCSVSHRENSLNIKQFLSLQADAQLLPVAAGLDTGFGSQLLPSPQGPDGFFYALLRKA